MTKPNTKCISCPKGLYRSPKKLKNGLTPICCSCHSRRIAFQKARIRYDAFILEYKAGNVSGSSGKPYLISSMVIRYIKEKYGNKCCKCGWNQINPKTGNVPVQINHINGNSRDHKESNLELLCPNCHSLTENYMNLNKGNGRKERYKKGESEQ